jgi:hypothetical protein
MDGVGGMDLCIRRVSTLYEHRHEVVVLRRPALLGGRFCVR